ESFHSSRLTIGPHLLPEGRPESDRPLAHTPTRYARTLHGPRQTQLSSPAWFRYPALASSASGVGLLSSPRPANASRRESTPHPEGFLAPLSVSRRAQWFHRAFETWSVLWSRPHYGNP